MDSSIEEEIKKEIKKASDWYGQKYKKKLDVHFRYDKQERHFSWRVVAWIGGAERVLPFGISEKSALEMMEKKRWNSMKAKIFDYIKQSLIKAQVKYEPHILALK